MSTSFNTSSSSSSPIQTPENDISNAISGVASNLANQMLSWAQGVYSQVQGVTSQAVGNFFQTSAQMLGLSGNIVNQYTSQFEPEDTQLLQDANSYNSQARQQVDMGQAGATQAQAGDAALKNSEAQLQSYGINPADGRYAALDQASAVQNAANVAGAENTQRNADVQIGQNLRQQAVQVGETLPGAAANLAATANSANAAAANSEDAAANTGKNLMDLPNDYLNTASHILPPAQQSSSFGTGVTQPKENSSNGGNGNGNQSAPPPPTSTSNVNPNLYTQPSVSGSPSVGGQPGSKTFTNVDNMPNMQSQQTGDTWTPETGTGTEGQQTADPFNYSDPFQSSMGPNNTQSTGFDGQPTQQLSNGASTYDPSQNVFNPTDPNSQSGSPYDTSNWQDPSPQVAQDPNVWGDASNAQGVQTGGTPWDSSGTYNPMSSLDSSSSQSYSDPNASSDSGYDSSSYMDTSGDSGADTSGDSGGSMDYSDFARGGLVMARSAGPKLAFDDGSRDTRGNTSTGAKPILNRAGGGGVPAAASPSQGQTVDDVKANLNAGEFVIPRDVAAWKGQEFFQKLIDQARARNGQAGAKAMPGGPQPGMR